MIFFADWVEPAVNDFPLTLQELEQKMLKSFIWALYKY